MKNSKTFYCIICLVSVIILIWSLSRNNFVESFEDKKMTKIAILLTGELRIPDFNNLYNSIKNYDIFISTYSEYYEIAKKITDNITDNIIITDRNDKCFNKKTIPYNNIYQWWHLDKLLSEYKERFKQYNILFKTRSDCYFTEVLTDNHFLHIDMNNFYMNSDHSFYGSTSIFYNIYENYYSDILNKYINKGDKYFKINYNNLLISYKNTQKSSKYNCLQNCTIRNIKYRAVRENINIGVRELVYPTSIYSTNNEVLIKNIENFLNTNKNIDNKKYSNFFRSANSNFGSEKYNFLNVVNKVIIKRFELPTIGIV